MAENRTEIKQREYLIGDMSEIVGVSRDTLRFYEKKGIIKARKKENGYRLVTQEVEQLSKGEVLALCKILLESRAFTKEQVDRLIAMREKFGISRGGTPVTDR